ncbi:MAG: TIGR02757 family protein [Paludibacteraceae bacterium]
MRNDVSDEIISVLDYAVERYNNIEFISNDPIQIPHRFIQKEDIEIAGFLVATIAWGNRKSIVRNGMKLMQLMDESPYRFLMDNDFLTGREEEILRFVHRTFNGEDCLFFLNSLQNIYKNYGGLETVFTDGYNQSETIRSSLKYFREVFLAFPHDKRAEKHISDVFSGSAAKRLNMFLRWMVRKDDKGVDFGLWSHIPMAKLMLPLDVHTGNVSRNLGLLVRTQNDWKAVEEITEILRKLDKNDPVKYDFALFGLGVDALI